MNVNMNSMNNTINMNNVNNNPLSNTLHYFIPMNSNCLYVPCSFPISSTPSIPNINQYINPYPFNPIQINQVYTTPIIYPPPVNPFIFNVSPPFLPIQQNNSNVPSTLNNNKRQLNNI